MSTIEVSSLSKALRSEGLAELHRLVNSVDEGLEGLVIVLVDGKEVIVCIEATTSLLLTISHL